MAPFKPKPKITMVTTTTAAGGGANKGKRRPKLKWRTRDSQNSQLYNLQLDINDLQQEIQQLQQTKSILMLQTRLNRMDDRDGSYVKVVSEYHCVFQHGFRPVVALPDTMTGSGGGGKRIVNTMEFLSRVMDDRVSIGRFVGLDMMRDQWTRYSRAFSNLELRHISSTVLPEMDYVTPSGMVRPVAMVSSKATYESVFSIETMELMFPHLVQRHRRVLEKLLGRTFSGVADFDFVFDTNSHRVIGYDFRLDFFVAFARLLTDPEDLCLLFEGAKISEEFLIGDLNVYAQTAAPASLAPHAQVTSMQERAATPTITELSDAPMDAEQTARQCRSIDPVVLKYATRASGEDHQTRSQQLHSKLTSILDPVDREPLAPAPVARVEPLPTPIPPQSQPQYPRLPSLVHDNSNRSCPWQLQMPSLAAPAPPFDEDNSVSFASETPVAAAEPTYRQYLSALSDAWHHPSQPSEADMAYFPASALAGRGGIVNHSTASSLTKRQNPFALATELFPHTQNS